jgi:hypothetical protein
LEANEISCTEKTNAAWREMVDCGKMVLQIAGKVSDISSQAKDNDLVTPWKIFDKFNPLKFRYRRIYTFIYCIYELNF